MGMFDYISVADALPVNDELVASGLNINNRRFQTKNLGKMMHSFIIQGGRLFEQKYKVNRWVDDPDGFAGGYVEQEEPFIEERKYHGEIVFYDFSSKDNFDYWTEYKAIFTHGLVEKIELIAFRKTDNSERRAALEEIFENGKVWRNKWYNKYLLHTKPVEGLKKILARGLYWVEVGIGKLRMNLS
jgi:hypothetical protein